MNRNLLIAAGMFLAAVLTGFFLVRKPQVPKPQTTQPTVEATGGVREIQVLGSEYSFNPSTVTFKKGETVKLTFTNSGAIPHNLVIDELGVQTKTVSPGKSDTVEFEAEMEGSFTFYCGVENHRSLGMEGEVVVEK